LCRADRQTAMTKPLVAFRNFAKAPKFVRSVHTVRFCVLSGYEKRLRVFPYGDLRDCLFYRIRVFITRSELSI
jgi:hypothetical protein